MTLAQRLVKLGTPLLPLGQYVPFAVQRRLIESAAARLFAKPLAEGAFDLLAGRWLCIEISDLGLAWCVSCVGTKLLVRRRETVDVTIRGRWRDFLLLASRREDPDTLFFRRHLVIEGDTDLGLGVKNLLDALEPQELSPRAWQLIQAIGEAVH
ncbi:SCP2 domain-containing protein [Pseudomonas sp. ALS1131]|nr:SCP2 sterol-binding domain-containing protein [Pseudomonas sp. ALS1131]TRO40928.1 SCP2 domain-containing protein [Pseudomonas sp. ALS1131]